MNGRRSTTGRREIRSPQRRSARGFALVEVIVYFVVLVVLLAIAYSLLIQCISDSLAFRRSTDDIVRVLRAGEKWRSDVRASREVRLELNAGEQILRLAGAPGEVSYRCASNCLYRRVDGQGWRPFLPNVRTADFVRDPRLNVTAWRCEIELQKHAKPAGSLQPRFTFIAVPTDHSRP